MSSTVALNVPAITQRVAKAQLLFNAAAEVAPLELDARLAESGDTIFASLPTRATYRRLYRADLPANPKAGNGFDSIIELEVDDPVALSDLTVFVDELGADVRELIDPGRSGAAAGVEYTFLQGDGDLRLVYFLHPKADWALDDFWTYWINPHSAFGPVLQDAPYRQFHNRDRALAARFGESFGGEYLDAGGAVHRFYRDTDDLARASANRDPGLIEAGAADTAHYVDTTRDTGNFFWVQRTIVGGHD